MGNEMVRHEYFKDCRASLAPQDDLEQKEVCRDVKDTIVVPLERLEAVIRKQIRRRKGFDTPNMSQGTPDGTPTAVANAVGTVCDRLRSVLEDADAVRLR